MYSYIVINGRFADESMCEDENEGKTMTYCYSLPDSYFAAMTIHHKGDDEKLDELMEKIESEFINCKIIGQNGEMIIEDVESVLCPDEMESDVYETVDDFMEVLREHYSKYKK